MPIIKSAKKKMRQDVKRRIQNRRTIKTLREKTKAAQQSGTTVSLGEAYSAIDTAVKKNIIHKNKAARLKSQLGKKTKETQVKKIKKVKTKTTRKKKDK